MKLLNKIWRPFLALFLIFILIKKGPFQIDQLKFIFTHSRIVLLGFTIIFLQILIASARWKLFIELIERVAFSKVIKLNLVGYFFNFFIPGGVGGDIVKALELSKNNQASKSQALSTVFSDRIFGLFSMITFTFVFLFIEYTIKNDEYIMKYLVLNGALFFAIVLSLLFFPIILKKISSHLSDKNSPLLIKLQKLVVSLHFTFVTFKNFKIQLKSFLLSFIGQLLTVYLMYEVVSVLGAPPTSFLIFFSLCCFSFVASAIPIFPAGIGVGQAAIYLMFSQISEELAKATITAITTVQIFSLFYAIIGGAIFSFMPKPTKEDEVLIYEKK